MPAPPYSRRRMQMPKYRMPMEFEATDDDDAREQARMLQDRESGDGFLPVVGELVKQATYWAKVE
jgi:hypothetical protein